MKTVVKWKDGMEFDGVAGEHVIQMDAKSPIGKDKGATPKELVGMGLGGCTAMDVIALMKKHKQPLKAFSVDVDIQASTGSHPIVFEKAVMVFNVEGEVDAEKLIDAVKLSQTKFCGVSAMLSKSFPIDYSIVLNGDSIATGSANFES